MTNAHLTISLELLSDDSLTRAVAEEIKQHLVRTYADILPIDPTVTVTLPSWAPERPTHTADFPPVDEFAGEFPIEEDKSDG